MKEFKTENIKSRQDMADVMLEILEPLKKYYSSEKSWLKLGDTSAHYPDTAAWMEGFSRPLWGLGAYWGGGSSDKEWEEIYIKGLTSGSNPKSEQYWGDCVPYDQMLVEMAAISFTILFAGDKILGQMNEEEKKHLFAWLSQINVNPCHSCNWRFFHVLVNVALKKAGVEYDANGMEESLKFLEDCYVGEGWYLDGINGQADYYVPFGMHFYGIIYSMFMKDVDPERCKRFVDRAMEFGKDYTYWFAEDGSGLPYGRSLTYRFAQASFFSACVMAHIEPIPLGEMKGIILRHMEYWFNKPIFDHDDVLTIGYAYPNLYMAESYNAPGSPYWSMKLFTCLTLPEDDPFWSARPLPLRKMEEIKVFPTAKMIMQRTDDGHSVSFPSGLHIGHVHTHMEEKYSKFAYSTKYGFSVMHGPYSFSEAAPDSVLSFWLDGQIFVRRTIEKCEIKDGKVISDWSPFMGINVHTEIIPEKGGHRRVHTIDSQYDMVAYDSGFAVPIGDKSCTAKCLIGDGDEMVLRADPNTNLLHSKTDIPTVKYKISKGTNVIETRIVY
ncbi:MAG: DUF2264 domain-containing protein [Lachnospiraceae bacterium]|nr:DUF2264 domain-containing protein [Lachnospiraceae bacterium]